MATATSTTSGSWSGAIWSGGSGSGGAPADDDYVVIAAGHSVLMDVDTSGWTNGIRDLTITGHASSTPGMLYFMDGTTGYIKMKTGYTLKGTNVTNKGRLLANSDGVWGNTGELAFANKATIDMLGTSYLNAVYLDIQLYCAEPTNPFVRIYNEKKDVSSINTSTNVITMGASHGWSANRTVSVRSTGTLPTPLIEDQIYFVGSPSGADLKLLYYTSGTEVDLSDSGSGTISIYSGYDTYTGVTQVNVVEDITSDHWGTTTNHNQCLLVDYLIASATSDVQDLTLASIDSATQITLGTALDSAQYPLARLYLKSRNISVRNNTSSSSQALIASALANSVFNCEVRNYYGTNQCLAYSVPSAGVTIGGTWCDTTYGIDTANNITITGHGLSNTYSTRYVRGSMISGHHYASTSVLYMCFNNEFSGVCFGTAQFEYFGAGRNLLSGDFIGCGYIVLYNAGESVITGTIKNGYALYSGSYHNLFLGTKIYGVVYSIPGASGSGNILRNVIFLPPNEVYLGVRNYAYSRARTYVENLYLGSTQIIYDNLGNILKTACDGTGDAPSVDPDGGNDYCVEASTIQSNCGASTTLGYSKSALTIIENQRIWLASGSHTITYKLQTTYSSISAGNLKLTCTYIGTDGVLTETHDDPAITTRSDDTDWSQELSVTFTSSADGWATCNIDLMQYEASCEVYVYPTPTIT